MLHFLKHGKDKEQPSKCADMLERSFCCGMSEQKDFFLLFRMCLLTEDGLEKSTSNFSLKERSAQPAWPAHGGLQLRRTITTIPSEIKRNIIPVDLDGLISTLKTPINLRFSFSKHWSRKACSMGWGARRELLSLLLKMAFCQNAPIYAWYIFSFWLFIFKLFYSGKCLCFNFYLILCYSFSAVCEVFLSCPLCHGRWCCSLGAVRTIQVEIIKALLWGTTSKFCAAICETHELNIRFPKGFCFNLFSRDLLLGPLKYSYVSLHCSIFLSSRFSN